MECPVKRIYWDVTHVIVFIKNCATTICFVNKLFVCTYVKYCVRNKGCNFYLSNCDTKTCFSFRLKGNHINGFIIIFYLQLDKNRRFVYRT